jgi:hypothetical protein
MDNNLNPHGNILLPASGRSLTRREWVQRLLAGAGAGIATPALAGALAAAPLPAAAPTEAVEEWKPAFFDDHQNQSLLALAERIVPGSSRAQVDRFLDTALSADTQDSQQKFVAALNALEGEALRQFTRSFKDLSAGQQDSVLTAAATAQPSSPAPPAPTADVPRPEALPPAPGLRDYFDHLKGWITMAYYSSEVGMKELGWTGESFFESFPGCEQVAAPP